MSLMNMERLLEELGPDVKIITGCPDVKIITGWERNKDKLQTYMIAAAQKRPVKEEDDGVWLVAEYAWVGTLNGIRWIVVLRRVWETPVQTPFTGSVNPSRRLG